MVFMMTAPPVRGIDRQPAPYRRKARFSSKGNWYKRLLSSSEQIFKKE